MKVLVVHNSYQRLGGEDVVVKNEIALLKRSGLDVRLYEVSNDSVCGLLSKLLAAAGVVFSASSYWRLRRLLRDWKPDVVHVHNFFPLISPAVFYACKAEHIGVVLTLHNFRIICPTGLLMHEGAVTERSLREGPWWAVKKRVYRGSLIGTFLLALMIEIHRRLGTWQSAVDRFIVLTEFARRKFDEAGLPSRTLVVKPNFVEADSVPVIERFGFLFVGRLSPEKGLQVLLRGVARARELACRKDIQLAVVGDGPLYDEVGSFGVAIKRLGALSSEEVRRQMASALALVLPSTWYEGFPMVLAEAYACGLPVIASRLGALEELVEDGVTGLLFEAGNSDDLAAKLCWAMSNREAMSSMGRAARDRYERHYNASTNVSQLMAVYKDVIKEGVSICPEDVSERSR